MIGPATQYPTKWKTLLLQAPISLNREDKKSFGCFPPLGLAYLAGVLLQEGFEVEIRDLLVEGQTQAEPVDKERVRVGLSDEEISRILADAAPYIVGISNNFTSFSADCVRLARVVRKCLPNALVVMGGAHASMEPKSLLETGAVDAVVIGEGEYVFRDLVRAFSEEGVESAREIVGTVWKVGQKIVDNGYRDPISDLDAIPFPAYGLLPMEKYIWQKKANFAAVMRHPVGHLISSRGCPYNCIFCSTTKHFKKFRKRSPENVLQEMKELTAGFGIREFHFHDDSFMADRRHVEAICRMIMESGMDIRWQVSQGINSSRLNEKLLELMHKSGMYRVGFPIESGCPEILRFIRKPIRLDRVKRLIEKCNYLGIYCFGCFMIGFPEETKEQLKETIDFIINSGLDYVKISITQPLVGSDLCNIYRQLNLYSEAAEESSTYFHTAYDTAYFTAEELNRIREDTFRAFSRQRIRNVLTPRGVKRFILPKVRTFESIRYLAKMSWLALRGY